MEGCQLNTLGSVCATAIHNVVHPTHSARGLGYWCTLKSSFHIQNDVKEIQWHKHTILFAYYLFFCYTVANKLKFLTWNIRNFDIILYHITFIRVRLSLLQILFRLRVFNAPLSTIFLLYRCGSLLQSRTYLKRC